MVLISVVLAILIGMPLAVWIGTSARANAVVTVFLDLMQTMPTFVYLLPIVLFFGIGTSAAVVATLIYALPPLIRIAGFGIREVPVATIEATDSSGQTAWQRLPRCSSRWRARRSSSGSTRPSSPRSPWRPSPRSSTGPGLGKPVLQGLRVNDVGTAFVPGALIVVMAVMLDRTTTAASERSERVARGGGDPNRLRRRTVVVGGAVVALVAVYLSRSYVSLAEFPDLLHRQPDQHRRHRRRRLGHGRPSAASPAGSRTS